MNDKISYKDAGVDIELASSLIQSLSPRLKQTTKPGQISLNDGFAGLFEVPKNIKRPVLVSTTDGVGTKMKLAFALNQHSSVGIDLVAMCVNDVIVYGAEPLYFLDYFATGKLDENLAKQVILGIIEGCETARLALIGGETAEMPDMYAAGEYDLAGFCVGVVAKNTIIDGSKITEGDSIVGLASSGVHSNGFSLIRKILADQNISLDSKFDDQSLGEALLTPTRIYVDAVMELVESNTIKGIAHITGGGIPDNLERIMPAGCAARIETSSWTSPLIFQWIQERCLLSKLEMLKTFNCGIGMIFIVSKADEATVRTKLDRLMFENFHIGEVISVSQQTTIFD